MILDTANIFSECTSALIRPVTVMRRMQRRRRLVFGQRQTSENAAKWGAEKGENGENRRPVSWPHTRTTGRGDWDYWL